MSSRAWAMKLAFSSPRSSSRSEIQVSRLLHKGRRDDLAVIRPTFTVARVWTCADGHESHGMVVIQMPNAPRPGTSRPNPVFDGRLVKAIASNTDSPVSPASLPIVRAIWASATPSTPTRLNFGENTVHALCVLHVVRVNLGIGVEFDAHFASARSSDADRSSMSAAGGFQEKTPHGAPSTSGVDAPDMPRMNR